MKSVKTKSATALILGAVMFGMLSFTTESVTAQNTESENSTSKKSMGRSFAFIAPDPCPFVLAVCPRNFLKPNLSAAEYPADAFD